MGDFSKKQTIPFVLVIFVFVLFGIVYVAVQIGRAYKTNLASVTNQPEPIALTHIERDAIQTIRLKKAGDPACIEVTPDGVVRIYSMCGSDVTDAHRLTNINFISRLFKLVTENQDVKQFVSGNQCLGYVLTVFVEQATRELCITSSGIGQEGSDGGGGSGGVGDDIIEIIEHIIEDIPPTPTPSYLPSPTQIIQPTSTPDVGGPTVTPTDILMPTPTTETSNPFTCDYTGTTDKKRPYNISNIICSTEPTPGE